MTAANDANDAVSLGLIAGGGLFPLLVADGARRQGCRVHVVALRGLTDPELHNHADAFRWSAITRPGAWVRFFRRHRVGSVILAGYVRKAEMFSRFRWLRMWPDLTAIRIWFFRLKDRRNDAVLSAIADEFARHGMIMDACTKFTPEHMAPAGLLTQTRPTAAQLRDADFGWPLARELGKLDIGQSVAVREAEVIAVEAIEGTDGMIERAGALCPRGGWTLIKTSKPRQDPRFDVPTVGPGTIEGLRRNGGKLLVIEAGKTLILEREKMIAEADAAGIAILARHDA